MKYRLSPWYFPRAQAIFHCIPLLSSHYSYSVQRLVTSALSVSSVGPGVCSVYAAPGKLFTPVVGCTGPDTGIVWYGIVRYGTVWYAMVRR